MLPAWRAHPLHVARCRVRDAALLVFWSTDKRRACARLLACDTYCSAADTAQTPTATTPNREKCRANSSFWSEQFALTTCVVVQIARSQWAASRTTRTDRSHALMQLRQHLAMPTPTIAVRGSPICECLPSRATCNLSNIADAI